MKALSWASLDLGELLPKENIFFKSDKAIPIKLQNTVIEVKTTQGNTKLGSMMSLIHSIHLSLKELRKKYLQWHNTRLPFHAFILHPDQHGGKESISCPSPSEVR